MTIREKARGLKIYKLIEDIYLFFYSYSLDLCVVIIPQISGKNRFIKKLCLLVCFPYIFIKGILFWILENTIFKYIWRKKLEKEKEKDFKYDFGIVVTAKNESDYIREWIAYHRVVCENNVHFFVYDNESDDNLLESIRDFVDQGYVTYKYFEGKHVQINAYNEAINQYKETVRYMAFIDVDEFLVLKEHENLSKYVIKKLEKRNVGGIGVNWKLFGSSGYEKKQPRIVTETFLKHGTEAHWGNTHIKTICNPRCVNKFLSPHYPQYHLGVWNISPNGKRQRLWLNKNVDWTELSLHHYFCKSKEEFEIKRSRGYAHSKNKPKYDNNRFINYDLNDCYDDVMLNYRDNILKICRINH